MITSIYFEDFNTFKFTTLPIVSDLNILIGDKYSNKNRVVDALSILKSLATECDLDCIEYLLRGNDIISFGFKTSDFNYNRFNIVIKKCEDGFYIQSEELFYKDRKSPVYSIVSSKSDNKCIVHCKNKKFMCSNNKLILKQLKEAGAFDRHKELDSFISELICSLSSIYFSNITVEWMRKYYKESSCLHESGENLAGVLHYLLRTSNNRNENSDIIYSALNKFFDFYENSTYISFITDEEQKFNFKIEYYNTKCPSKKTFLYDSFNAPERILVMLALVSAVLTLPEKTLLVVDGLDRFNNQEEFTKVARIFSQVLKRKNMYSLLITKYHGLLVSEIENPDISSVFCCKLNENSRFFELKDCVASS